MLTGGTRHKSGVHEIMLPSGTCRVARQRDPVRET
jgi:hypothetical protein